MSLFLPLISASVALWFPLEQELYFIHPDSLASAPDAENLNKCAYETHEGL